MARARADTPPGETRRLVGYRLLRGVVLFRGRRHRTLPKGTVVAADDEIVPLLFQNGAELEHVTE